MPEYELEIAAVTVTPLSGPMEEQQQRPSRGLLAGRR
jgi:hypothetical protein